MALTVGLRSAAHE